jgi:predicted nucleic-acid-binding Zn-ribbon protein
MHCPICGENMTRINDINEFHHNKLECNKCEYKIFYREHHKKFNLTLF